MVKVYNMKTYAIVIRDHEISEHGFNGLLTSSFKVKNDFEINRFDAVVPKDVDKLLDMYKLKWNYPWSGEIVDFASGLVKRAYVTANPKSRIAAALSHFTLWQKASCMDEPILILEHDACFNYKMDLTADRLDKVRADIIGINNPLGCTCKASMYYQKIINNQYTFQPAPYIDDLKVPQGLAGNSAYIIKPSGAIKMLKLVQEYGLWPNDAIMCKQLIPNLYVTRKFYTTIQNLRSTTTQ